MLLTSGERVVALRGLQQCMLSAMAVGFDSGSMKIDRRSAGDSDIIL